MSEYQFTEYELQQLAKLPAGIAALAEKYPVDIVSAAEYWDMPPLPEGYVPDNIEIYYDDHYQPYLSIECGKLTSFQLREPGNEPTTVVVMLDHNWAYAQIEGRVILDRLGGVVLPDVLLNPVSLLQTVLNPNFPVT